MKKIKKRVIIYTINDSLFTMPLVLYICKVISKEFDIEILLSKRNFFYKLKVLLCFIFFGSLIDLYKLRKKKVSLNEVLNNKIKLIYKPYKKYSYGLSINHSNKIKINKNFDVYNFHLGNFNYQRGIFIFFYKYLYNWKYLDLTFHKIDKSFDKGEVLNTKKIDISKKNSIQICSIYQSNYKFIKDCLRIIKKNKTGTKKKSIVKGLYNSEPSFLTILKVIFLGNYL